MIWNFVLQNMSAGKNRNTNSRRNVSAGLRRRSVTAVLLAFCAALALQDIIAIQNSDVFIYTGGENDVWVEDILSSMPDSDLVTLRLVDCVETVEEEQVEGMKGSAGHDHDEEDYDDVHGGHTDEADEADGEDEEESPHEADEHVWM